MVDRGDNAWAVNFHAGRLCTDTEPLHDSEREADFDRLADFFEGR